MSITALPIKGYDLVNVVAENVRAESARRGVKQADLARIVGITSASLNRKWHGKTPWTLQEIDTVAESFGITPWDLVSPYETKAAQVVNYPSRRAVHRLGLEPRTLWLGVSAGEEVKNVIDLDIFKARRAS